MGGAHVDLDLLGDRIQIDATLIAEPSDEVRRQLREYGRGERRTFDLTVDVPDDFTGRVMERMLAIPYGETRTYGDLAEELDTAPVAVGGGCGRNPVPVVVPCHRVLRSDGGLGGYSGSGGVGFKRRLLGHEAAHR